MLENHEHEEFQQAHSIYKKAAEGGPPQISIVPAGIHRFDDFLALVIACYGIRLCLLAHPVLHDFGQLGHISTTTSITIFLTKCIKGCLP